MAETVKGLNIKLGLDTTELEANIKSLNSELKEQQKDLAAINKNLRYDSGNVDLWKQKQEKLNQILTTTKTKLAEQNRQLEEAKKAVEIGAMSQEEFNKLKRSVQYTEAEIKNLNNQLNQTGEKIGNLSKIDTAALGKVGESLTKYVTAPAIAAATALTALALKTSDTVNDMNDAATSLGVSLETLQEWEYAAKQLGSETEYMDKAFQKVNTVLGQIASGKSDAAAESLALIGLTIDDIKGLNAEQAFQKIRAALANVEDAATRVAVANAFFGEKLGTSLAPVLSATEEELQSWREEAQKVGIVSSEDADAIGEWDNALYSLKQATLSLSATFAATL